MRGLLVTLTAIIITMLGFSFYEWFERAESKIAPLAPSLELIGVIDMDDNHDISIEGVKNGNDLLVVLDKVGFTEEYMPTHPQLKDYFSSPFDLIYYDTNKSGEIDSQESIWNYLYVVIYSNNGNTYTLKPLSAAGIHAILAPHLTAKGNHEVLLSDGDTRILYETKKVTNKGLAPP